MNGKIKNTDIRKLKDEIDAENDIDKIGRHIHEFSNLNWGDTNILISSLNIEKLKNKLNAERNVEKNCMVSLLYC